MSPRLRWLAIGIFIFSTALNYLDRQLVAALAPSLKVEFHLTNSQYGQIIAFFSILYSAVAPLAGLFIDRVGLNIGVSLAMIVWSTAGAATGLAHSFRSVLLSRSVLGIAEAAGIPCFGKASGTYLEPRELALGMASNQVGVSMGLTAGPLVVAALAPRYGWRMPFIFCGALGLIWVPIWLLTSKRIPARPAAKAIPAAPVSELLRDRRLWGLVFGTIFCMSLYTLWSNWTTLYFVQQWHLTQEEANRRFAWIPPAFSIAGAFFGGWLAFHWIRAGKSIIGSRLRVCWISAAVLLITAAVPLMPTVPLAAAAISLSSFWAVCISINLYALPIDMFGPARAAFGTSILTSSYGLLQAVISPAIGATVDHFGFSAVCVPIAVLPLIGVWILRVSTRMKAIA